MFTGYPLCGGVKSAILIPEDTSAYLPKIGQIRYFFQERIGNLTRRTVQEEQARLRKKRQKAQGFFSIFKKPMHESLTSVLPIMLIVLALGFTIAPVPNNAMMAFLLGGVLLIGGMGLFTLVSEMSMIPLGQAVGSEITRSKKVWIIVGISFLIGIIITVAEPDLQVLANQVPAIQNRVIIWSVAVGVGVFLVIALLRILLGIQLRWLLIGFYVLVFGLAMFVSPDFWAVAFDSGGVTTGPMTVPFIMALGVGVSAVRSDKQAGGDSFGLVALCSIGPIITVLLLGLLYQPDGNAYTNTVMPDAKDTVEMFRAYVDALPEYFAETAKALAPNRLCSSQVVSSTVMSGRGAPDSNIERSPSKMAAMPALSSAERIVSPAEQTTSAMRQVMSSQIWRCSMTASMPAQGFTVSRCAENPMRPGTVPAKCAMRLPVSDPVSAAEASKVTVNPISASFSAQ